MGLKTAYEEINTELVRLSKRAVDGKALVAGDMTDRKAAFPAWGSYV